MKVHILGCYSATPRNLNNPTAQVIEVKGHLFLVDCGEGTQVALRKHKIRFARIKHIFISHLHGDHFFGLPGLVSTFRLLGREAPLHIYGPKGIKEAVTLMLKVGQAWTNYPLHFHELEEKESVRIFEDEKVTVDTLPLKHRVYTNGFLFREKPGERKLLPEKALEKRIDPSYFRKLKQGEDVLNEYGEKIRAGEVTLDPEPTVSYAFCSDTAFNEPLIDLIKNVSAVYHESTFLEIHRELAVKTGHSTALEAATVASRAKVGMLILGHYSTRYPSLELFRQEALKVFDRVSLADDGKSYDIVPYVKNNTL